jgi:hypothetical protein
VRGSGAAAFALSLFEEGVLFGGREREKNKGGENVKRELVRMEIGGGLGQMVEGGGVGWTDVRMVEW